MTKLKRRLSAALLVLAVSLASGVVSTYFLFPYERVADYLIQEIERPRTVGGRRKASGWRVAVGSLRPTWLPGGAVMKRVQIGRAGKTPEAPPLRLTLSEVTVRVGILSYLLGTRVVDFEARIGAGRLQGTISDAETETGLQLQARRVPLHHGNISGALSGIPVRGHLSGHVSLVINDDKEHTSGDCELQIQDLVIGDTKLVVPLRGMGSLTLPPVRAGELKLAVDVEKGAGTIAQLQSDGDDVAVRGAGGFQLVRPVARSHPNNLLLRLSPSEDYKSRDDITTAAFTLLESLPAARPFRTPDGAFQIAVNGNLARLSVTPAGSRQL